MAALKALEWFFYACVNLLPQMALVTIACRDFLRFSLKKTIILSMGVLLWYWFFLAASEVNWASFSPRASRGSFCLRLPWCLITEASVPSYQAGFSALLVWQK